MVQCGSHPLRTLLCCYLDNGQIVLYNRVTPTSTYASLYAPATAVFDPFRGFGALVHAVCQGQTIQVSAYLVGESLCLHIGSHKNTTAARKQLCPVAPTVHHGHALRSEHGGTDTACYVSTQAYLETQAQGVVHPAAGQILV